MRIKIWLAIPAALILAALPAVAGVCELQCAARVDPAARLANGHPGAASESCPLHAGAASSTKSSGAPCHGQLDGRGAALVSTRSAAGVAAPQRLPGLLAAWPSPGLDVESVPTASVPSRFERSSGRYSLRSILRL